MKTIRDFDLFLLDMDGTIYLGDELFPETPGFLDAIRRRGARYLFLTNNSSKDKKAYAEKLNRLGIAAGEDDVFSSGDATAVALRERGYEKLFVLGTKPLLSLFEREGFRLTDEDPDAVVLGFDTDLTYRRLLLAHGMIKSGIPWIATHPDLVCPVEGGKNVPDTGSMIRLLEASTGKSPDLIVGKPNRTIIDAVLALTGGKREKTIMVGDRLYTDVAVGERAGIASALVLTGETSLRDYETQNEYHADFVYPSVGEMAKELNQ